MTEAQRAHVRAVADQIERAPARYDQDAYGDGQCLTPCCIAGHSGLLDRDPCPQGRMFEGYPEGRAWAERRAAALGLDYESDRIPLLFHGAWPADWLDPDADNATFTPTAEQAAQLLRKYADGYLNLA